MSAEETVFSIPELRIYILSYYLDKIKEKHTSLTCRERIQYKIDNNNCNCIYMIYIIWATKCFTSLPNIINLNINRI